MSIQAVPQVMGFTLDRDRQCRARGHVFQRDFRLPTGEFQMQEADNCFRCGEPKAELVVDE